MIINHHDYCITFWKISKVFPVIIDLKGIGETEGGGHIGTQGTFRHTHFGIFFVHQKLESLG